MFKSAQIVFAAVVQDGLKMVTGIILKEYGDVVSGMIGILLAEHGCLIGVEETIQEHI